MTPDWNGQRKVTVEQIDELEEKLSDFADRHAALSLDVALGKAHAAELDALESEIRDAEILRDRARDSMAAIDRREQADQAKAAADARRADETRLHSLQAQRAKLVAGLVADVAKLAPLVERALKLEADEAAIARRLGVDGAYRLRVELRDLVAAELRPILGQGVPPMPPSAIAKAKEALTAVVS